MSDLAPSTRQRLRAAWAASDSFATTLLLLLVDAYGTAAFTWQPETILLEIHDDFGVDLSQGALDRLYSAIQLHTSNSFYWSLPEFIKICCTLTNGEAGLPPQHLTDAQETAWGLTEAILIVTPDEEEPFTDEIRHYIGAVLDSEGILDAPDILKLALRDAHNITGSARGQVEPESAQRIYAIDTVKTSAINDFLRNRLRILARQLAVLPLKNGDARDIVQRILRIQG